MSDRLTSDVPDHIAEIVEEMARLHGHSRDNISEDQRLVDHLTTRLVRPASVFILVGASLMWMLVNTVFQWITGHSFDPPPFPGLELAATLGSLFLVILVLATQRREDELAELREQLNLQLAMLNERKTAKILAILDELRRDNPRLQNREDPEASAMMQPADLHSIVSAIQETHEDPSEPGRKSTAVP